VRDWQMTEKIFQAHKHQRMKSVEFSVHWLGSTNHPKDYSTLPRLLVRTQQRHHPRDLAARHQHCPRPYAHTANADTAHHELLRPRRVDERVDHVPWLARDRGRGKAQGPSL
jgi:tRNA(Met) C34 N-acetyltransferase TmcA